MRTDSKRHPELVKVRLRLHPAEDEAAGESLWASPVQANSGGGTYRLENNAFFAPLACGDVVAASLDGDGMLQMTGLVEPCQQVLSGVSHEDETEQVTAVLARWRELAGDCFTEGTRGSLVTVWPAGMDVGQVAEWVGQTAPGWFLHFVLGPVDRTEEAVAEQVNFELSPPSPRHPTDYWVGDDPVWAAMGLRDPGFLAQVQSMAEHDPRVAATLKNGRHANVLTLIERLAAHPSTLAPLDGPLLDEAP